MVPITSGWPAWPISRISRPVADDGARPRYAPWRPAGRWRRDRTACALGRFAAPTSARHGRRTPPARRCPGSRPAPRRRSRPWPSGSRPRSGCGRSRGAHRPARRICSSASSTIWMARSTPAQKPRGAARRMVSGGRLGGAIGLIVPVLSRRKRAGPVGLVGPCRAATASLPPTARTAKLPRFQRILGLAQGISGGGPACQAEDGVVETYHDLWWLARPARVGACGPAALLSACAVSSISSPFKSGTRMRPLHSVNADRLLENAKADAGRRRPSRHGRALSASRGLAA